MAFVKSNKRIEPRPIPPIPPYVPPSPPTPQTPEEGSQPSIDIPLFSGTTRITFYNTGSDAIAVDKELTASTPTTIEVTFKEDVNVLHPVLYVSSELDLSVYNYCYIEGTRRYYYISVEECVGGMFSIEGNVDVLMSFRTDIRKCVGILSKVEADMFANMDLDDGSWVTQEGMFASTYYFSKSGEHGEILDSYTPFETNPTYILIATGKDELPDEDEVPELPSGGGSL